MTHHVTDARGFEAAIGTRLDGRPLALMLDIDGTLAPIAPRPQDAMVPEATRATLHSLIAAPDVHVVLVSGRSAGDAAWMASVDGAWVVGNHGLELRAPDGAISPDDAVLRYEDTVQQAARALARIVDSTDGAILEDKRWTLSLHYRLAEPSAVPALLAVAREVAAATGLRVTEGKMVIELRPPVDINKGTATIGMAGRLGALARGASILCAGDDRTDEDAFDALRHRTPHAVTLRVGGASPAGEVDTRAEFAVAGPDELREILGWLAARRSAQQR